MGTESAKAAISVEASDPEVEAVLLQGLLDHAGEIGATRSTFNVVTRDDAGAVRGGVSVIMNFDVLWLKMVWLDEAWRGHGHGRPLIDAAEAEGRRRGAVLAWLETFDWQARPFYERLGYAVYAELPHDGGRHTRFFMKKTCKIGSCGACSAGTFDLGRGVWQGNSRYLDRAAVIPCAPPKG